MSNSRVTFLVFREGMLIQECGPRDASIVKPGDIVGAVRQQGTYWYSVNPGGQFMAINARNLPPEIKAYLLLLGVS